jgi:hypothetical protein
MEDLKEEIGNKKIKVNQKYLKNRNKRYSYLESRT